MAASMKRTNFFLLVKPFLTPSCPRNIAELSLKRLHRLAISHNVIRNSLCTSYPFDRKCSRINRNFQKLNIKFYSSISDNSEENSNNEESSTANKASSADIDADKRQLELESTNERLVNETTIEASPSDGTNVDGPDYEVPVNELEDPPEVVQLDRLSVEDGSQVYYTEAEKKLIQYEEGPDILYIQIDLTIKSVDREVLKSYHRFLNMAAEGLDIKFHSKLEPKHKVSRSSLLKSVHIYKKHFRQYENRTHILNCTIHEVTGSTASVFLEYIQRNLPEGMAMKVCKHQIDMLPEHLKPIIKSEEVTQNQENHQDRL